ncbi:hypothetical protein MK805_06610 [Shimazuella sp. AN120528]|uniref:hypothetical protein n=1 Tax=Shimazuella soli TaxID=1892854 RepID=UPI001F0EF545|nr:hypothetical protein [Shimazuella soli]MCH5584640.1 hypothetical protein [Shimazuella soli]
MSKQKSMNQITVNIHGIAVNVMDNTSGIFVGETTASGWSSKYKSSTFFRIGGNYNFVCKNSNIGFDNDLIDTYIS